MIPEVGKRYKVRADDCCVLVCFTAVLMAINEEESEYDKKFIFDNGVVLDCYTHSIKFEEAT
jgi:hypothetical protein